jgi:hypothetical protein
MPTSYPTEAVEELEHQLVRSLQRIEPNPEFINHLHYRLKTPATTTIERRHSLGIGLFLTALSLVVGLFLVVILKLIRAS